MASTPSPEVNSINVRTPELATAISSDPLAISHVLLSKGLISTETLSKMLIPSYTSAEKATIVVETVRNSIEIAPAKFEEFLRILSEQAMTKSVVDGLRSTHQSLLQNQAKASDQRLCIDIAAKIDKFEDRFCKLREQIVDELRVAKNVNVWKILNDLTGLPAKIRKEYEKAIKSMLPTLKGQQSIDMLFLELNSLISFIDFSLLEHIIKRFGSDNLKADMTAYCSDIRVFMEQTTVQQLIDIDYLPGQPEIPPNFEVLKAKIGENASTCTLERINTLRKRFCAEIKLSEVIFHLIALEDSNSFILSLVVPSVLVPDIIEAAGKISSVFFQRENIVSLSVGSRWLFNPKLFRFGAHLKTQYQQSQATVSPIDWMTSPTKKVFRLAMIQRERVQRGHIEDEFVRMTISGMVDDILHAKTPVEIQNIFRDILPGRKIILIEGAPGSGKSTLTIHICQRWGKEELFEEFTVVILVQLRDPAVQRAQLISELLPCQEAVAAQEIAKEIIATNGRGVLWVLDGWDELPPHLQQDSIFRQLLPPKPDGDILEQIKRDPNYHRIANTSSEDLWIVYLRNNPKLASQYYSQRLLNESSVIVTSRPISSGDLHPVVSSRIEVLGFTPDEQQWYFAECLKGDDKGLEALLERIQENPVVQSICYLPLNAAFVVHTFKCKGQSLPNTVYEIYISVILSCINRHFKREGKHDVLPVELKSLGDLSCSEAVRGLFLHLCELAYHGVMENKVTFSSSDLPRGSNTLSLLQGVESFLQSGKSVFYNFIHLSIQEILAAYYIATCLPDNEQVAQFQQLFNQPRFVAVFQFYSAITKLKNPGVYEIIDKIVVEKSKPLLVALLRCLYEAQDPSLCQYVVEKLEHKLDLYHTSLSPLDCLSISFFLSSVTSSDCSVDLLQCHIGDQGVKCLTKYLGSGLDHNSKLSIYLLLNDITEEGASYIAEMLCSSTTVEHLYLSDYQIGDTGVSFISKALMDNVTLKTLVMYNCGITSRGAEDLSRALAQNSSLEKLDIGENKLGDEGISHVAEALKQNRQLKELWISECGMTDKGAASLASALSINNSLKMLYMGGYEKGLTEDGVSKITQSLTHTLQFKKLTLPIVFKSIISHLAHDVNGTRHQNGLPAIEIEATVIDTSFAPSEYGSSTPTL